MRKIVVITILMMMCIVSVSNANAFNIMGFDVGETWESFKNWVTGGDEDENVEYVNAQKLYNITINQNVYSVDDLNMVFENEENAKYVRDFGYECIYLETDKGVRVSLFFDLEEGNIKSMYKGEVCENKVVMQEALIDEIETNGFRVGKANEYLKMVDLPWGMYAKAIKVFTVG